MKIGLLSDTHGYLDERILNHFRECDEIWHAGDIGSLAVLQNLTDFKPIKAVFGNIDDLQIRSLTSEEWLFEVEGLKVFMTHIGGSPPAYSRGIKEKILLYKPRLFICGHSHILQIKTDRKLNNMLFINPGAAGKQGFHRVRTLIRFEVKDAAITHLQVIELGSKT